jgi:hypothetical protein
MNEVNPDAPAPESGDYEELNIFGSPTGCSVRMNKHDRLPACHWDSSGA